MGFPNIMKGPKGGGTGGAILANGLIATAANLYTSSENRKMQRQLAEEGHEFTSRMEDNRQNFQLEINRQNAQLQEELSRKNHDYRVQEQLSNFQLLCQQAEWNVFLHSWPFINPPVVIRNAQLLSDNTVALGVFLTKSRNDIFEKLVYPGIEQGLREFNQIYHNNFASRNITFYQNAFTASAVDAGNAISKNIQFALSELPVLIIDAAVVGSEVVISYTAWGLNGKEAIDHTCFKLPFNRAAATSPGAKVYLDSITAKILARIKFIIGYAYDSYNLFQYNRAPLLPQVAMFEKEQGSFGAVLDDAEVANQIAGHYGDIYRTILSSGEGAFAQLPEFHYQSTLHQLRLAYAEAFQELQGSVVDRSELTGCLNESLDAWVYLRSELPAELFLQQLADGTLPLQQYFSPEDRDYFLRLRELYGAEGVGYSALVEAVCKLLETAELTAPVVQAEPLRPYQPNHSGGTACAPYYGDDAAFDFM